MVRFSRKYLALWLLYLATVSQSFATTVHWLGNAQAVKQVTTITVSGTWAAGDKATVQISTKKVTVTVGSDVSTSNIADILARAINGTDDTPGLLNDETRNVNGQEVPEFTEVVASNASDVLTLTSATAGVPFSVSVSETTAGTGALGTPSPVTAATGPNFWDNGDNWDAGVPGDGDVAVFNSGSVSVLYALDYMRDANYEYSVEVTTDYGGSIGLPKTNANGYKEYRDRRLELYSTSGQYVKFTKGAASSTNVAAFYLDGDSQSLTSLTVAPDVLPNGSNESLELFAGTYATLVLQSGNIALGASSPGGTSVTVDTTLIIGRQGGSTSDCTVNADRLSLVDCETIEQLSGIVHWRNALNYTGGGTPVWNHRNGTASLYSTTASRALKLYAGTVNQVQASVIGTATLYGGTLSNNNSATAGSGQTIGMYAGSTFIDERDAAPATVIDFVGCTPSDVTLTLAKGKRATLSTP